MDDEDHEHSDYIIETGQVDYYDPGDYYGHGWYEYQYYVCGVCGEAIDRDVADPELDRIQAREDWEADNWDPDR